MAMCTDRRSGPTVQPAAVERSDESIVRVVVLDDERILLDALQVWLKRESSIAVVGMAQDGPTALALIAHHRPAVLLLDLDLPGMQGEDVARRVLGAFPEVAILIFTGYYATRDPRPLLELGVRGWLPKTVLPRTLVGAISEVAQGRTVVVTEPPSSPSGSSGEVLTARERDVLRLLTAGLANAEIAAQLTISVKTVEEHVTHILAKLGARSVSAQ